MKDVSLIAAVLVAQVADPAQREPAELSSALGQLHQRLDALLPAERLDLLVEARCFRVVVEASDLSELIALATAMQKRAWRDHPDARAALRLAVGISVSPVYQVVGGGRWFWDGTAICNASRLAEAAAPGAILLDQPSRDHLELSDEASTGSPHHSFGSRLIVGANERHHRMTAFEVIWSDSAFGLRRRPQQRRRGRLHRWRTDTEHGFVRTEDGDFFYVDRRFLTGSLEPAPDTPVYFLPKPPLQAGKNPVAAALVPVGDRLEGEVIRIDDKQRRATIRVADRAGNAQELLSQEMPEPEIRSHDIVSFRVSEADGEPLATDVLALAADEDEPDEERSAGGQHTKASEVTERFLAALMEKLSRSGARGAALAVRRATRSRPAPLTTSVDAEWGRVFALIEHGRRDWAHRSLDAVDQPALAERIAALEPVDSPIQAEHFRQALSSCLAELSRGPAPALAPNIRPILTELNAAASAAARMTAEGSGPILSGEPARVAILHTGQACAEAFLNGVITAIPPVAKAVASELDSWPRADADPPISPVKLRERLVESLQVANQVATRELLRREQNHFEDGVMTTLQQGGDTLGAHADPQQLQPIEEVLWMLIERRLATLLPLIEYDPDLFADEVEELALFAGSMVPTRSSLAVWRQGHRWVVWMVVWSLGVAASAARHWKSARVLWDVSINEEGQQVPLAAIRQLGGAELGDHLTLARFGKRMPLDGLWHLAFRLSGSDLIHEHYPRMLRSEIPDAPLAFLSRAADWAWCVSALSGQTRSPVTTKRYWEASQVHMSLPTQLTTESRLRRGLATDFFRVAAPELVDRSQEWIGDASTASP